MASLSWRFCGGGGGDGSEEFLTSGGVYCEAGLVVFEWEGDFL